MDCMRVIDVVLWNGVVIPMPLGFGLGGFCDMIIQYIWFCPGGCCVEDLQLTLYKACKVGQIAIIQLQLSIAIIQVQFPS